MEPQYLGDGVYATLNDFGQIALTTGDHDPAKADNTIYLEPEVIRELIGFMKRAGIRLP
jgi:hypothetical protein